MIKTRIVILGCCILGWGHSGLYAQSNTVAAGGDLSGAGGSISYSLGQTSFTTLSGSPGSMAQGVQQPYIVTSISADEVTRLLPQISVYPNPATDMVMLNSGDANRSHLSFRLYDLHGKNLGEGKVLDELTPVSLAGLANATYFLKVTGTENKTRIFKIIKNK